MRACHAVSVQHSSISILVCALLLLCRAHADVTPEHALPADASAASAQQADAAGAASQWQLTRTNGRLSFKPRAQPAVEQAPGVAAPVLPAVAPLPRCALIMHYHVQRTGGTHVRALMSRSAAGGQWEAVAPTAFRASWPRLRIGVLGGPRANCAAEWASRRILMEVQANSNYRLFMDEVLPQAAELRARYAQCNCTSALSVLLREPWAQAVSMYRHFALPRRSRHFDGKAPPSLSEWLLKSHDPQTRALLGYNIRVSEIGGKSFDTCTPGAQQRALRNLQGFNVIGVTERLDDFLAALSARTGWHETLEGAWAEVIVAARNAQSYEGVHARWRQDALGAEEQAALAQHTACDAVVYRAAAALAQAPPHAALSTADVRPSMLPATPPPDEAEVATTPERRAAVLAALRARRREHAAAAMAHAPEGSLPRCALVVFYHVAKTGGSYVRFLMQASRAGGEWSFDEPEDFRNVTWPFLRDSVLARSNGTADGDSSACAPLWERGRLLAEVHANAGFALWARSVAPALPTLRQRYAACGCGLTTGIVLREPLAAAVSAYRFFPLRQMGADAPPLSTWIVKNHDPQTKAVLGFNLRPPELPGGKPFSSCTPVAEEGALANLAAFDVVGVTDRLDAWLSALAVRSGWVPPKRLVNAQGQPTDDERITAAAHNAQSYEGEDARWRMESLPQADLDVLRAYTRCDASLYAAAQTLLDDALAAVAAVDGA